MTRAVRGRRIEVVQRTRVNSCGFRNFTDHAENLKPVSIEWKSPNAAERRALLARLKDENLRDRAMGRDFGKLSSRSYLMIGQAREHHCFAENGGLLTCPFDGEEDDAVLILLEGAVEISIDLGLVGIRTYTVDDRNALIGEFERFANTRGVVGSIRAKGACSVAAVRGVEFDRWVGAPNPLVAILLKRLYERVQHRERALALSKPDLPWMLVWEALRFRHVRGIQLSSELAKRQARSAYSAACRKLAPGRQSSPERSVVVAELISRLEALGYWHFTATKYKEQNGIFGDDRVYNGLKSLRTKKDIKDIVDVIIDDQLRCGGFVLALEGATSALENRLHSRISFLHETDGFDQQIGWSAVETGSHRI